MADPTQPAPRCSEEEKTEVINDAELALKGINMLLNNGFTESDELFRTHRIISQFRCSAVDVPEGSGPLTEQLSQLYPPRYIVNRTSVLARTYSDASLAAPAASVEL
ncbi:hypothetical protein GOODEAATRI_029512 [Goodea atripinnis]|uniref:Uncharacterized protein n=1 Tax=Goodea atripinnis TaxID=208336 RepID=A0ABV0PSS3_9TELE